MNELHLFAGAGGGILGGHLLGHTCVCAVEWNPYARRVLLQRQRDNVLPRFPIWDDVQTFDGQPWQGRVDVVCGGFPCQDVSAIGKGAGIAGNKSGLWKHMARIIGEIRPRYVFVENSPLLVSRGLDTVVGDLSGMGYASVWGVIGADDVGFAHRRKRIWIVGYPIGQRLEGHASDEQNQRSRKNTSGSVTPSSLRGAGWKRVVFAADCDGDGYCPVCEDDFGDCGCPGPTMEECQYVEHGGELYARARLRFVEPALGRVANGVAHRVDRLTAIGNGQVPAVAALAWRTLMARIESR